MRCRLRPEMRNKHWSATQEIRQNNRLENRCGSGSKQFGTELAKHSRLNRLVNRCIPSGSNQGGKNQTVDWTRTVGGKQITQIKTEWNSNQWQTRKAGSESWQCGSVYFWRLNIQKQIEVLMDFISRILNKNMWKILKCDIVTRDLKTFVYLYVPGVSAQFCQVKTGCGG